MGFFIVVLDSGADGKNYFVEMDCQNFLQKQICGIIPNPIFKSFKKN